MIEDVVLSPILIFLAFATMLLLITRAAFSNREVPGYILGWMIGIFFIIIYQSITGGETEAEVVEETPQQLSFLAVVVPSMLGLLAGFGSIAFLGVVLRGRVRRSAAVTIITALLIIVLFLVITLSESTVRLFGIFALAYGIGILSTIVFSGRSAELTGGGRSNRDSIDRTRERFNEPPPDKRPGGVPRADDRTADDRFKQIRRPYDDR